MSLEMSLELGLPGCSKWTQLQALFGKFNHMRDETYCSLHLNGTETSKYDTQKETINN